VEKLETLVDLNIKWYSSGTVWHLLKKSKQKLPYDPEVPLLSKYSKELKRFGHNKIWTLMFIAAAFTIARKRRKMHFNQMTNG
jgi:hypothetical protein